MEVVLTPEKDLAQRKFNLVVADDDQDDCLLTRGALEESQLDYEVHFVHDGAQLLEYLRHGGAYSKLDSSPRPHLILLDLNLPVKDGHEVLRNMQADPILRNIPVVILSTSTAYEDMVRSQELGAIGYITRPPTFEGLVQVLRQLGDYMPLVTTAPPV